MAMNNSLAEVSPELVSEWSEKNLTLTPDLICGGSGGGAQTALAAAGINLFGGVSGDVDKAVEAFINETLGYNPDGLIIFLSLLVESDG